MVFIIRQTRREFEEFLHKMFKFHQVVQMSPFNAHAQECKKYIFY